MNIVRPLVSIVVITYNASKYIIEMLESAKSQTYESLELIVSDDCSTDNTVDVCTDWFKLNKKHFLGMRIITAPINTGVSANLNRGIRASTGQFVKPIAGDDALVPTAIEEFVNFFMISNSAISISRLQLFGAHPELLQRTDAEYDLYFEKLLETQKEQSRRICKELYVPGPGIFFTRELYDEINGFDENYPFCEEWPFFFSVLNKKYRIVLLEKKLVKYRVSEVSLCRTENKMDKRVFDSVIRFFTEKRRKEMIKRGMIFSAVKQTIHYYIINESYKISNKNFIYNCYIIFKKLLK